MLLKDRIAIVTGGSRGIGYAIAEAFAREGAHLALLARTPEELETSRARIATAAPVRVLAVRTDVSVREETERAVSRVREDLGEPDILVHAAGVQGPIGPFVTNGPEAWELAVRVNLFGAANAVRAVLPGMLARRRGKILVLGGGGSVTLRPRVSAYAAAKAAVVRLAETVAEEARGQGVDVNVLAPGAVTTRMTEELLAAGPGLLGTEHDRVRAQVAGGGERPDAAARLAVLLASDRADGVTGRIFSARWDDMDAVLAAWDRLKDTDSYTMRRVVPEDRALRRPV